MSKTTNIVIMALVLIVVAAGSFWAGGYYKMQSLPPMMRQIAQGGGNLQGMPGGGMRPNGGQGRDQWQGQRQGQDQGQRPGGGFGGGGMTGTVDKIEDDTLTITTRMGSLKVKMGSKTEITKSAMAKLSDIKKGTEVMVRGEGDISKSIDATSVMVINE